MFENISPHSSIIYSGSKADALQKEPEPPKGVGKEAVERLAKNIFKPASPQQGDGDGINNNYIAKAVLMCSEKLKEGASTVKNVVSASLQEGNRLAGEVKKSGIQVGEAVIQGVYEVAGTASELGLNALKATPDVFSRNPLFKLDDLEPDEKKDLKKAPEAKNDKIPDKLPDETVQEIDLEQDQKNENFFEQMVVADNDPKKRNEVESRLAKALDRRFYSSRRPFFYSIEARLTENKSPSNTSINTVEWIKSSYSRPPKGDVQNLSSNKMIHSETEQEKMAAEDAIIDSDQVVPQQKNPSSHIETQETQELINNAPKEIKEFIPKFLADLFKSIISKMPTLFSQASSAEEIGKMVQEEGNKIIDNTPEEIMKPAEKKQVKEWFKENLQAIFTLFSKLAALAGYKFNLDELNKDFERNQRIELASELKKIREMEKDQYEMRPNWKEKFEEIWLRPKGYVHSILEKQKGLIDLDLVDRVNEWKSEKAYEESMNKFVHIYLKDLSEKSLILIKKPQKKFWDEATYTPSQKAYEQIQKVMRDKEWRLEDFNKMVDETINKLPEKSQELFKALLKKYPPKIWK